MEFFEECFSELADLETFDPKVFLPDEEVSKDICGFILALALIYTDIKNLTMFYEVILKSKPGGEPKLQKNWGEYAGLVRFLDRLHISILHELFNLVARENNLLNDKYLINLIHTLNKGARIAWQALVDASLKKVSTNKFSEVLMFIRNKITFHYDRKIVLKGFEHYINYGRVTREPFISRGYKMVQSRFYFADAAVESYLLSLSEFDNLDSFFEQVRDLLKNINNSIYDIVINFIQRRGGVFRQV